jgi:hypothetical protein
VAGHRAAGLNSGRRGRARRVRAIFLAYLLIIIAGLAFYTVIGLTHH